jgi:hypothetical protein
MTGDDTPRERLARVEERTTHISQKVDDIHIKVEAMHAAYLEGRGFGKGAKWVTYTIAGAIGYLATYLPKISTLMSGLPK